jgi:SAM-dependent methyltransferase
MASDFNHDGCTGLDYSAVGCEFLMQKIKFCNLDRELDVINADMFSPPLHLIANFDFVFTYGVVEHFSNTAAVMLALKKFLKKDGVLFTIIPNMAGVCGWLTKKWAPHIYKMHNPLDLEGFKKAHIDSNLEILYAEYLCSSNFSVISSCFPRRNFKNPRYYAYIFLVKANLIIWRLEKLFFRLPPSKLFSPYILITSRLKDDSNKF